MKLPLLVSLLFIGLFYACDGEFSTSANDENELDWTEVVLPDSALVIYDMFEDEQNRLWLRTKKGLAYMEGENLGFNWVPKFAGQDSIFGSWFYKAPHLYVTQGSRLDRIHTTTLDWEMLSSNLPTRSNFYISRNGRYWASYFNANIYLFGRPDTIFQKLWHSDDGSTWVADTMPYLWKDGLAWDYPIKVITESRITDNKMWLGTTNGLYYFEDGEFVLFNGSPIRHMALDNVDRAWYFDTSEKMQINGSTVPQLQEKNACGEYNGNPRNVFRDGAGNMWWIYARNIYGNTPSGFHRYCVPHPTPALFSERVKLRNAFVDSKKRLWGMRHFGGLFLLDQY